MPMVKFLEESFAGTETIEIEVNRSMRRATSLERKRPLKKMSLIQESSPENQETTWKSRPPRIQPLRRGV